MSKRIFSKVLLVAVAIFGVLAISGVLSAQGLSHEAFERVREVQERHTDQLLEIKGVEGTAVGFNQNNRPAVKVFVARWDVAGIPGKLDDIPVQVVVTGKFYALGKPESPPGQEKKEEEVDPTARFERPVPIGVSTGHPDITAGTIGCRVTDGTYVYALSNNHVYANCNNADEGDNVLQPGAYDGGALPNDAIGTLYDFVPIDFDGGDNTIDAAIALTSTNDLGTDTPSDGYGIPSSSTVEDTLDILGLPVQKYGRTTGLTKGKVSGIEATVKVYYGDVDGDGVNDVARFVDQILITPTKGRFSAGGDSGSLIVTDPEKQPVGLLFAGSSRLTIANPIEAVLSAFSVDIDDGDAE